MGCSARGRTFADCIMRNNMRLDDICVVPD